MTYEFCQELLNAMSTEAEFLESYDRIKDSYKTAMAQVEKAISHEEAETPEAAIAAYEEALQMIEATFAIPVGLPDQIDAVQTQWNDACALIQRLKSAKTEISYRLKVLRVKDSPIDVDAVEATEDQDETTDGQKKSRPLLTENPSTFYDVANASGRPKTYRELAVGLRELLASRDAQAQLDELFQAQVKLYRIESSGQVTTVTGSTKMSLIMCTVDGKWKYLSGIYFIQCDMPQPEQDQGQTAIWLYPLVPNVTNCYCTEYGAFILPDMESGQPGNAFGLMLEKPQRPLSTTAGETEEEQMADMQQFFLDLLEAVLAGTVEQLQSPRTQRAALGPPVPSSSEQVSKHIVCAADFIARNLIKGAEKTGDLMMKSTPYIMSKMTPAAPDAQAQVPSSVQTGVEVAQKVTHAAAGVTGWIAGKVGTAAVAVGGYLSPHIQTQGSRLLQKGFGYDSQEANSTMEGAMTIAAGAVEGFSTVFDGLEQSAKILGNNLSQNSVKIIEHKYGASAGNLASGTFDTVGNAFIISQNANYITPKGLAKKLVKKTGEAVVVDYLRKPESHYINAGALYPDLRALKEESKIL